MFVVHVGAQEICIECAQDALDVELGIEMYFVGNSTVGCNSEGYFFLRRNFL